MSTLDYLPFRFKAGGGGGSGGMAQHSHRPTVKTVSKPFKSRHASKSALKEQSKGKIEKGTRKTPHQQVMSKLDRRNRAKQLRSNHNAEREEKASVFHGKDGAARIVALIPLCSDVQSEEVLRALNSGVDIDDDNASAGRTDIPRFKQTLHYLTPARNLFAALDACRLADFVLFVLSANEEVDELGEQMLRCIESQGVSTILTGVVGLDEIEPAKKRLDVVKSLKSYITHFFATQEKVHDFGNRQECSNVMRSLCTTMPKGIRWREDRSWMLVENFRWEGDNAVATGVVRGKALKADRLVQVGNWGDFQIVKVVAATLRPRSKRTSANDMVVDESTGEQILDQPSQDHDNLDELAPEDVTMDGFPSESIAPSERKAVLLDDHHYFDEDNDGDKISAPKRLPKGTSKYQAAWYLDDVSDSGSDLEDVDGEDDGMDVEPIAPGPADGHYDAMIEPSEIGGPSEYPQSEAFLDQAPEDEADQIEAYRKQRRNEAEDDLEFPDEIELHPHVNAQERLARYRGLKSLRESHWDTEEDKPYEPEEWARLLQIGDYKSAKNRTIKEATLGAGVSPGSRVEIYLHVPSERRSELESQASNGQAPQAVFSILRHEHKKTALNVSISLSGDYPSPIKSKEELILQCGPRRMVINPLFSQGGNTPNNVHKFERYLHPGRTAVATFVGPMIWGSVPCLFFKKPQPKDAIEDLAESMAPASAKLELIGTGTSLPPSTQRIIAKRIILTGHPYKIHKKLVTVRYMFFNAEDVNYFRALELWTKRGRSGFVKEPLGTHGYFKATFDGKINPLDSVAVSLYKRVWPRTARIWTAGSETEDENVQDGGVMVQ